MPKISSNLSIPQPPTLRLVALAAGVSLMTASRALRPGQRISKSSRKHIRKIALALGYSIDPKLGSLMKHLRLRNKPVLGATLAALTSFAEGAEPPQFNRLWRGAKARANELGYELELFRLIQPGTYDEKLERRLIERGIGGILMLPMQQPGALDHLLTWGNFSVVSAAASIPSPNFARVEADHFENARLICERVAQKGGTRIGFIELGTRKESSASALTEAIACRLLAEGKNMVPSLAADDTLLVSDVRAWLRQARANVIIATDQSLLPLLTRAASKHRGSITVLCAGSMPEGLPCGGVDERPELIGQCAVDALTDMLARGEKNRADDAHATIFVQGQ